MSNIITNDKKFNPNVFGQLTVSIEEEQKFIAECDLRLTNLSKKDLTVTLQEILKNYSFKEGTARTIWKIHNRKYKPPPKIRVKKGQSRYTPEEQQLYIAKHDETKLGPTELYDLELLKNSGKKNPSVSTISVWLQRATNNSLIPTTIDPSIIEVIVSLGKIGKTVKEIIEIMQTSQVKPPSRKTIENTLVRNGIDIGQGKSVDEKIYICETALQHGIPITPQILLTEGIKTSETQIRKYFHDLNIPLPDMTASYRKYSLLNENFFSIIDTEEKAYWLGFIAADGGIRLSKLIEIELKRSDIDHLHKFTSALGTNKKIYETEKYDHRTDKTHLAAKIAIFSKQLVTDLLQYNIGEQKSLTLDVAIDKIPGNLHRHFWRGYFDGDGHLAHEQASNLYNLDLGGTEKMVSYFKDFIYKNLNIQMEGPYFHKIWYVRTQSKNLTLPILKLLYKDANIFLDRKHQLYNNLLTKNEG